jgi:hypothetical protein
MIQTDFQVEESFVARLKTEKNREIFGENAE